MISIILEQQKQSSGMGGKVALGAGAALGVGAMTQTGQRLIGRGAQKVGKWTGKEKEMGKFISDKGTASMRTGYMSGEAADRGDGVTEGGTEDYSTGSGTGASVMKAGMVAGAGYAALKGAKKVASKIGDTVQQKLEDS